jgi:hypothetical protein
MVTIIKKDIKVPEIEDILAKRGKELDKKRSDKLKKHFGSLKRGIDGLEYQKNIRNEWK